jgi:pSer/pThr/pTyr-binding forkhead associated (FHA) protein
MARLVLTLDGQVMAEYNMNKERYTVGRLPDNDIRIDNPAVSGHHSLIINILNDSFLEDLNSTNGTYVNGKLIKKHALQHGDVITVGHHQLRFVEDDDAQQDEFERTMVIQPSQRPVEKIQDARAKAEHVQPSSGSTSQVRALPEGAQPEKQLKKARLQVLSGAFAGRELELAKALTTLGRPGVQVAAITRRSDGFYIVHVEADRADNYPLVNGTPIGAQARRLVDNDVIQLAGVKMGFFEN